MFIQSLKQFRASASRYVDVQDFILKRGMWQGNY